MPIDVRRLLASETWVLATGDERSAAMCLWLESWHQIPAASLPDNPRMLAHLAQCTKWPKVQQQALRGWINCSDGRLYHPVVAEKALVKGKLITGTEAAQSGSYNDSSLVSLKGLFVNQGGARIVGDTTVYSGNFSVDKTDQNARHYMKAQYGTEYAEISVAGTGLASMKSVDGNSSVAIELLGTTQSAIIKKGSGSGENIITSPDFNRIVKVSQLPQSPDANTMYLVELNQQQS